MAETREGRCARLIAKGGWAEDALRARCTPPIGPWNTYSNAAYALSGGWLYATQRDEGALVMALSLVVLALGSAAYHAFKTSFTNKLDWVGMYAVFGALVGHAYSANPMDSAMLAIGAGLTLPYLFGAVGANALIGAGLVLSLLPALRYGTPWLAGLSMALFVVAYACWQLDLRRSPLVGKKYGHSIWHYLTGPAFVAMYLAGIRLSGAM